MPVHPPPSPSHGPWSLVTALPGDGSPRGHTLTPARLICTSPLQPICPRPSSHPTRALYRSCPHWPDTLTLPPPLPTRSPAPHNLCPNLPISPQLYHPHCPPCPKCSRLINQTCLGLYHHRFKGVFIIFSPDFLCVFGALNWSGGRYMGLCKGKFVAFDQQNGQYLAHGVCH